MHLCPMMDVYQVKDLAEVDPGKREGSGICLGGRNPAPSKHPPLRREVAAGSCAIVPGFRGMD